MCTCIAGWQAGMHANRVCGNLHKVFSVKVHSSFDSLPERSPICGPLHDPKTYEDKLAELERTLSKAQFTSLKKTDWDELFVGRTRASQKPEMDELLNSKEGRELGMQVDNMLDFLDPINGTEHMRLAPTDTAVLSRRSSALTFTKTKPLPFPARMQDFIVEHGDGRIFGWMANCKVGAARACPDMPALTCLP